jgi:hypothetical protein
MHKMFRTTPLPRSKADPQVMRSEVSALLSRCRVFEDQSPFASKYVPRSSSASSKPVNEQAILDSGSNETPA